MVDLKTNTLSLVISEDDMESLGILNEAKKKTCKQMKITHITQR
jgi:hypothetical protein